MQDDWTVHYMVTCSIFAHHQWICSLADFTVVMVINFLRKQTSLTNDLNIPSIYKNTQKEPIIVLRSIAMGSQSIPQLAITLKDWQINTRQPNMK